METSNPRHKGEVTGLSSGLQPPTPKEGVCLTFWYHMYGAYVNTLNVYVQDGPRKKTLVWTKADTQGNVWRKAQRTLHSVIPYQVTQVYAYLMYAIASWNSIPYQVTQLYAYLTCAIANCSSIPCQVSQLKMYLL